MTGGRWFGGGTLAALVGLVLVALSGVLTWFLVVQRTDGLA